MIVRTLEHQRKQTQERFRTLALALEGVRLALGASGAAPVENISAVQNAFRCFVDDLMGIGGPPQPEPKLSLAALKFKYGSPRWRDHLDELREEDRIKIEED